MAKQNIGVARIETGSAYTNGRVVYLPEDCDRQQQMVAVVVQSALIAAGSLDAQIMARLMGRKRVAQRYLTLEAIRALKHIDCAPRAVEKIVFGIADLPVSASPRESFSRAVADVSIPSAPALLGILRPSKVVRAGGAAQTLSALKPLPHNVLQQNIDDIDEADDDDDLEESTIMKMMSVPVMADNFFSRFLRDHILKIGRSPDPKGSEGGAELPVAGMSAAAGEPGEHARLAQRPAGLAALEVFAQPATASYPEWDWERNDYRPNWCSVVELDPAPSNEARVRTLPDVVLQRNLARLGLAFETHKRRYDGEALDLRALVDFSLSRIAGEQGDERIYETRLRTSHDLGVVVLLDASGSTAERSEAKLAVWDKQRRLAWNLVNGLEQVGDRVAAYGFRSHGRQDVRFLRLKDFDNRFDGAAQARLDALKPAGYTRLGAAVRHAAHIATTRAGTSRMLLVLISDGLPYEDGYDGRHAIDDTRRALAEAIESGVGCVCISVGAATGNAALQALWGDASYLRISDPLALGPNVEALFRSALRSALEGSHGMNRGKASAQRAA